MKEGDNNWDIPEYPSWRLSQGGYNEYGYGWWTHIGIIVFFVGGYGREAKYRVGTIRSMSDWIEIGSNIDDPSELTVNIEEIAMTELL